MKKFIRYCIIVLLFAVQLLFLFAIFRENSSNYTIPIFICSLMVLLLYTYLKHHAHEVEEEYESLKVAVWVPIGALISYYLNQRLHLGPVLATALVGTVASFVPNIRKSSLYLSQLPAALYCGAFVGMSSPKVTGGPGFVLVAGIFTAIILMVSRNVLKGVGGKFGTLAFLGVLITYLLFFIEKHG